MSDRLLQGKELYGENGLRVFAHTLEHKNKVLELLKAQDTKTAAAVNAEWVEWGESTCPHTDEDLGGDGVTNCYRIVCGQCWQERKRSVGL